MAVAEYRSVTPSLIFVSTIVATTMRAPRGSSPAHSLAAPPSALRPPRMASDSPSGVQAGAEAPQSAPRCRQPFNGQAALQQMQWERAADAPQSAHGAERAVVGRAARHPQIRLWPERLPCRAEHWVRSAAGGCGGRVAPGRRQPACIRVLTVSIGCVSTLAMTPAKMPPPSRALLGLPSNT